MNPIDVSVVLVPFKNPHETLRQCLLSLAATRGVKMEIFVVDNAPSNENAALIAEFLPYAQYLPNATNVGFSRAVNQGMARSTGRYVLLLNPDTRFGPDVLAGMVAHMDHDAQEQVGVGSCIIRNPDGTLQESMRRFPTLHDQLLVLLKIPHFFKKNGAIARYMMRDCDPLATQNTDSIMGAFMMIRREVIDRVGMFDERFFIWFEEVDYCKMAVDAGYVVRQYGDLEITHEKGQSFSRQGFLRRQRWIRQSMRKYFLKHYGRGAHAVLWCGAPLFLALSFVAATVITARQRLQKMNDETFRTFCAQHDPQFRDVGEVFLAHLARCVRPESVLLDVGCGRTVFGKEIYARAARRIGIDPDPYAQENPLMDEFRLMHDGRFPLDDASVDIVTAQWVVEHVDDPALFLEEIRRVLRPGGVFIFMTTNFRSPAIRATSLFSTKFKAVFRHKLLDFAMDETFPTRYRMNTLAVLPELAAAHGLTVQALEGIESYGYFRFSHTLAWCAIQWGKFLRHVAPDRTLHIVGVFQKPE